MHLPIYLDHAATTPVHPEVLEAMLPYFSASYGNPSAIYSLGHQAREAVENAREIVAGALHASPKEIIFTSGGTESDNAALTGALPPGTSRRPRVLTTPIEHSAVLATCEDLGRTGVEIEYLPVDADGLIDPRSVESALERAADIVSVMFVNNEIGVVEPIAEIGAACRSRAVLFHTDAVQAFGKLPIDVDATCIDMLSLSAHKIYGPKGVGALYLRRGTRWQSFHRGGDQEAGRRGGTLNVPSIVGLGKAVELAIRDMDAEAQRLGELRDAFLRDLETAIPAAQVIGSRSRRLPNNAHVCFPGIEGEALLLGLNDAGVCASAGSACSAGSTEPSHVLLALGLSRDVARSAVRMTLGRATTGEALDYTVQVLRDLVTNLRALSNPMPAATRG